MRAILMFHDCDRQSHKTVSTDHNFWRKRRAKADSNQSPSAYQPNTISLGQTDSLLRCVHCAVFCCTDSKWLISLMLFGSQTELAYSRTGLTNAMSCQVSLKRSRSSGFFTIGVGRAYLVDVDASLPGSIWGQHDAQVESIVDWAECLAMQSVLVIVFSLASSALAVPLWLMPEQVECGVVTSKKLASDS